MGTAKKVVPMVGEEAIAVQVGSVAKYTAARLGELRSAIAKVGQITWGGIFTSL